MFCRFFFRPFPLVAGEGLFGSFLYLSSSSGDARDERVKTLREVIDQRIRTRMTSDIMIPELRQARFTELGLTSLTMWKNLGSTRQDAMSRI